jgi:hypothetical protein
MLFNQTPLQIGKIDTWKLIRVISSLAVKSTAELGGPSLRSKKSALDMEEEFCQKKRKNRDKLT